MHAFHKNVADGSVPDYNLIENLKKKYPSVLHGRPREQIREHACGMKTRKKENKQNKKNTPLLRVLKHVEIDHIVTSETPVRPQSRRRKPPWNVISHKPPQNF